MKSTLYSPASWGLAFMAVCLGLLFLSLRHTNEDVRPKLIGIVDNLNITSQNLSTTSSQLVKITAQLGDDKVGVLAQIVDLRKDALTLANTQLTNLQTGALGEVDKSLELINGVVDTAMSKVDGVVGIVSSIRDDLKPTLQNSQTITGNIADLTGKDGDVPGTLRDTRFLMARAARTVGHIEQASDDIRGAVPKAVLTWQGIGTNVQGVTANLNTLTHPRLVDRILGYTLSGAALYRDLNPGYNLGAGIRGLFTKHKEQ